MANADRTMKLQGARRFSNLPCAALVAWLTWPALAHGVALFALTNVSTIVEFDSAASATVRTIPPLLGFGVGENLVGIALRPANQRLYALTRNAANAGALYTINTSTGVATFAGALTPAVGSPYTALSGTHFAMKFNPSVDRLRLVSDDGTNMRVVPDTAQVLIDTTLNPGSPHVVGVAYTNSFAGAASTTLYDIDSATDNLLNLNSPNSGNLTVVGALGFDVSDELGFDIATLAAVNYAYAGFTVGGTSKLYTIDLTTGAASPLGNIGTGSVPIISLVADVDYIFRNGFQ
jgi:Domain of unknown function (DUF4394)